MRYLWRKITAMTEPFLPHKGGFRNLTAYKVAVVIDDLTYIFTQRYFARADRTIDQMVQASRSGKQNIIEGSLAGKTSSETEIKLTNVAKASLGELLEDYHDYLRRHALPLWDSSHPRYRALKEYARGEAVLSGYRPTLERLGAEELANLAVKLIERAMFLLERLLERQQRRFLEHGGIKEQMLHARLDYRRHHPRPADEQG